MSNNIEQPNEKISYGNSVTSNKLQTTSLGEVIQTIRTGSNGIKEKIEKIRSCPDTEKRKELKQQLLPYFNLGTFKDNIRRDDNFERTRHILLDIDHVGNGSIAKLKEQLKQDSQVYLAAVSPSGDGIKVVYRLDKEIVTVSDYTNTYKNLSNTFNAKYNVAVDKTKDPSRACFLTYDPEIYVNEDATPIAVTSSSNGQSKKATMLRALKGVGAGNRRPTIAEHVGMFIEHRIDKEFALEYLKPWNKENNPPLPEAELKKTIDSLYEQYAHHLPNSLANYWSYGTDILEIGIVDSKFYQEKNSEKKVYARVGAFTDEEKARVYSYLVKEKHIAHISVINFLGDIDIPESHYVYDSRKAIIDVHYAAVPVNVQDNQFIEDYLGNAFGKYKQFIKEWLAVYCYTNHEKLPFLVLTGKRGSSKNTFAETIGEIFPSMSTMWHGLEKTFNPECEMKLLIADETISNDLDQYRTLKKYSGQEYDLSPIYET